jgi:hypothetical protein
MDILDSINIEDVPVTQKTKQYRYRKEYSPKNILKFVDTIDNSSHYFSFYDLENKEIKKKEHDDNIYTYAISTYDPNLNIRITATNTVFSISIIVDHILINIYKKILHNQDNIVKSITENQQLYKGKAIDELCKMSEFIYENIDFIKTIIKIKCAFMKKIKVFYQHVNINTNELNKLKLYKEFINYESEKPFNLNTNTEVYTFSETQKYTYGNPWSFYIVRLTNIHNKRVSEVINKQSAEFVKDLNINELLPDCYKSRWLVKTKNKLFIGQPLYNKFINNNKYLNYYYGKPVTNLKYQAFDVSVDNKYQSIRQKSKIDNIDYDFATFIKYNSIINIVVSQPITDNFNLNSTLKNNIEILNKNEIITKQLIDDIGLETFYMIYRLLKNWSVFYYFFPLKFKEEYDRFKIYINEYITNIIQSAVENLKYNLDNYDILSPFLDKVLTRKITTLFIITKFTNIKSKRLTSDILRERNIEVMSKEYDPIIILDKEVKKEHLIFLINQKFTSESMATYEKFITRIGLRLL